ncbi:MAG: ABC transporter permease [Bryobacterales bacterium]|nr:ABC transporter permease [Bryobacterales bacterium]
MSSTWQGDVLYAIRVLVMKDFRVRYRNMSLGVGWSLLNPLVMMTVLWFVFTQLYPAGAKQPHFPLFVLCGLVPYNFFTISWVGATVSLIENAQLIKRVPVPREIIPVASVLSNCVQMSAQLGLVLAMAFVLGVGANRQWIWLPVIWGLFILFVCGLGLLSAALDVYVRDLRYVVESVNVVLFWLVPIWYSFSDIAPRFRSLYLFNPVAAIVLAMRNIMLDAQPPPMSLVRNLALISGVMLAVGFISFRLLKRRFYEYL